MDGPTPAPVPVRSVLGRVDFWGRVVGNLYCEPDRAGPRDADFLIGGNMAYRREIVPRLEFDLRLNEGVAFNYEVDLGLQLRAMELRIMVDPSARVRHYSAPRATAGMRRRTEESVRDYARNLVLVMGRRLPLARRIRALLFHLVVGDRTAWGPGSVLANLALTGRLPERGAFGAAQRGKLEAVLALLGGTPRPY
jgi:GT2 family glycosyltransferase